MADHRQWHTAQYQKWIQSQRWLRLRNWYICEHPFCERCEANGIATSASCVHHVTPVESGASDFAKEQLMFSPGNLQSLCKECHRDVHVELRSATAQLRADRITTSALSAADNLFGDGEEAQPPTPQPLRTTLAHRLIQIAEREAKQRRRKRRKSKS